jgi:hypothetical protein
MATKLALFILRAGLSTNEEWTDTPRRRAARRKFGAEASEARFAPAGRLCLSQIRQSAQPNGKREKMPSGYRTFSNGQLDGRYEFLEPRVVPRMARRFPGKREPTAPKSVTIVTLHRRQCEHFQQIPEEQFPAPSRGATFVPMMQTAHVRHRYHTPQLRRLHRTTLRRVLLQRQVRSALVIILQEQFQMPTQ